MQKFLQHIILLLLLFITGTLGVYAQTETNEVAPDGEQITNTATATYIDSSGEIVELEASSNTVVLTVEYELDMLPNNVFQTVRGKTVSLTHFLTNKSDEAVTIDLSINNVLGDDFDLNNIEITQSRKFKGDASGNNNDITNSTTEGITTVVALEPGENYEFTYQGTLENAPTNGKVESVIELIGIPRGGGNTVVNRDTVKVLIGTDITLEKNANEVEDDIQNGDSFTYTLQGENVGDITAFGRDIIVDGIQQNKVMLLDSIPANLTFSNFEFVDQGTPVYHLFGDDQYEFVTTLPSDLKEVDVIAVLYDSIEVNQSFESIFRVTINDGAIGSITNVAFVDYLDAEGDSVTTAASGSVQIVIEGTAAINYFTDNTFSQKTSTSSIGVPLHVQANASLCNERSSQIEIVNIVITSTLSGDREQFVGVETERNSGKFRIHDPVPTRNSNEFPVIQGNSTLEVMIEDQLIAELLCAGIDQNAENRVIASLVVDIFGTVYDSETGKLIPGATVELYDVTGDGNGGNPGGLATTYDIDGVTEITNTQVTGEDGRFSYPFVLPSVYRIEITPPDKYNFPSEVGIDFQPTDKKVDSLASYGLEFSLEDVAQGIDLDVPLDGQAINVLFSDKKVDKTTAEIGDYLNYSVEVRSEAVNTVNNLVIEDKLPLGFEYLKGSTRINNVKAEDPEGDKGPILTFTIDSLETGKTVTVQYRVLVGPGSQKGDGINTAIATSDELIAKSSNRARVEVEIRGGVFSEDGYVYGKVFVDVNRNDVQDVGEPGIPGVRLYLENGTFVITDVDGNYTMYGIKPNKHILKLDNTTLPKGATLNVLDNRHANDPSSRFVDLKKGEFHRADFAVCNCDVVSILTEVQRRIDALSKVSNEISTSLSQNFSMKDRQVVGGNSRNQASGVIGGAKNNSAKNSNLPPPETALEASGIMDQQANRGPKTNNTVLETDANDHLMETTLEDLIRSEDNELAFLNISDRDTVVANQIDIWVKARLGALIDFNVNGEVVPVTKIGKQVTSLEGVRGYEFVAIDLQPGENTLELLEVDPFGNVRGNVNYTILAPGELSTINFNVTENNVPADGLTETVVELELKDNFGIHVASPTPVTLDISEGRWNVQDLNTNAPGVQILVENGYQKLTIAPSSKPMKVKLVANVGVLKGEGEFRFIPDLRPLLAAGIIEGTLRFNESVTINSASDDDGFERELKQLAYDFNNFKADGRVAFFLKGKVSGSVLLTAGYDSEKAKEDRLFRDIRPDEYYPVYGESSVKGFDAQTSGQLYIRLDKERTYALYGDFITQERNPNRQLGDYSRSQTGIKANLENDLGRITVFTSLSATTNRVREFQALGLSRYTLPDTDIIENSEIIELVTYDREQPDVIISVERQRRFVDYILEDFSGTLIFTSAISSVDEEFNPVKIRAIYEVENSDEKYVIGGINGAFNVTDELTVAASVVQDNNPENKYNLASANIGYDIGKTKIVGEIAQTSTDNNGTDQAGRVELQHRGDILTAQVQVGKSGENFANRVGTLGQGRTEARAKGRIKVTSKTSLKTDLLYSVSDTSDDNTMGGTIDLQQNFKGFNAQVGFRYSKTEKQAQPIVENTNLKAKITSKIPFVKNATAFGEYEQDLNAADRKLIAVGGDYKLKNNGKMYARHEFVSSAGGLNTLTSNTQRNNTVFGFKTDYMRNGEVFSEYRVNDAFDGRSGRAAIGVKNSFQISRGFTANLGFERQFTVEGPSSGDATAVSGSIAYTANPNWKASTRAEARFSTASNTYLNSFGYGQRINTNWTLLAKNILSLNTVESQSGFSAIQDRFRIGLAFRDTYQNKLDGLFRYEFKYEERNTGAESTRISHVFSSHGNYHPVDGWTFSGRVAAKASVLEDGVGSNTTILELISGRIMHDINDKWDAGINASLLANSDFTTKDYGLGIEAGYIVARNLRFAAGYNIFGYEDEDLANNSYSRQGVYAGFSYKFDEQLFDNILPTKIKGKAPIIDKSLYLTCEEAVLACVEDPVTEILTIPITRLEIPQPVLIAKTLDYDRLRKYVLPKQIHFDNDKSYINMPAAQMLDKVASYLMHRDDFILDLSGFTDSKATNAYNMALALRRALAARAYLIAAGLSPKQMTYESLGEELTLEELNRVEMAMNRRVEVNIDEISDDVKFISQIEDLQVNKRIAGINNWDYIFNSEHNAVPTGITLKAGSNEINEIQVFYFKRIINAMIEYPEVILNITLPVDERLAQLSFDMLDYFSALGISGERIRVYGNQENGENEARFSYENAENLKKYDQNDDVKFANNQSAITLMQDLLRVLEARDDYQLLRDRAQTYTVPDRLYFAKGTTTLTNETEAVISRIGSYLRSNEQVILELRGTSSTRDRRRTTIIKDYLIEWGISADRMRTIEVDASEDVDMIRFEYKNADKINLLRLPKNLKGDEQGGN